MEDLLNFTDKYYFKKMIFDGGKSAIFIKNISILVSFILVFGFFINRCMGHMPQYNHIKIGIILIIIFFVTLYSTKKYLTPLIFKYKSKNWKKLLLN